MNRLYCMSRTYLDFIELLQCAPNTSVVEVDTAEGKKGGKGTTRMNIRRYNYLFNRCL